VYLTLLPREKEGPARVSVREDEGLRFNEHQCLPTLAARRDGPSPYPLPRERVSEERAGG
jgi:hypothetical protein